MTELELDKELERLDKQGGALVTLLVVLNAVFMVLMGYISTLVDLGIKGILAMLALTLTVTAVASTFRRWY